MAASPVSIVPSPLWETLDCVVSKTAPEITLELRPDSITKRPPVFIVACPEATCIEPPARPSPPKRRTCDDFALGAEEPDMISIVPADCSELPEVI